MSRVVGEHPWTEVYESQDADSSWSTEGTAFRGFYVPGNSLYFCFFFSFCQAIFLHHLEILLLTFTFKSRPVSHFSQPSLPSSLLPALSSGLGAGQLTQSKRPRLCCGSQAHTIGLTSWVCTVLPSLQIHCLLSS